MHKPQRKRKMGAAEATMLATIRRDSAEEGMRGGTRNRIIKCQAFIQALQTGKFPLPLSQHESEQTPRRLFGHHFDRVFFILFIFWTGRATRREGKGRRGRETRRDPDNARGLVHCSVVSSCEFCGPRTKKHPRVYCSAPLMYLTRKRRTITSRGFVIIFTTTTHKVLNEVEGSKEYPR